MEQQILASHAAGELSEALTRALEGYGDEVLGFLLVRLRGDSASAADVFSILSEDLWRGLGGFRGESSFRTWMYVLARNAAHRYMRASAAERRRRASLSEIPEPAQRVRTETLALLRTGFKERLASLRAELDPEDEQLLVLRLNRGLDWKSVAAILVGETDVEGVEVVRAAARYRQRYRALKVRLKSKLQEVEAREVEPNSLAET